MRKSLLPLVLLLAASTVAGLSSCKKCRKEDPRVTFENNNANPVIAVLQSEDGSSVTTDTIQPGMTSSPYMTKEGVVNVSVTIDMDTATAQVDIGANMSQCYDYTIYVAADGNLTSTPTDRNE